MAWITYLRSSSTVFRTSVDSALTSAFMGMFKLTRIFFDLKSIIIGLDYGIELKRNLNTN